MSEKGPTQWFQDGYEVGRAEVAKDVARELRVLFTSHPGLTDLDEERLASDPVRLLRRVNELWEYQRQRARDEEAHLAEQAEAWLNVGSPVRGQCCAAGCDRVRVSSWWVLTHASFSPSEPDELGWFWTIEAFCEYHTGIVKNHHDERARELDERVVSYSVAGKTEER